MTDDSHEGVAQAMEDLEKKFKQERKILQAKIQVLKKSATKGDKKKKKEVQDEITNLEADLERRHKEEEENLKMTSSSLDEAVENNESETTESGDLVDTTGQGRITRAEKRRQKKVTASKERDARILEQEDVNLQGQRHKEMVAIVKKLKDRDLAIHSIIADGNCLYSAIEHQLNEAEKSLSEHDCSSLRELTANHLRENRDEFLPFMSNSDTGDPMSESDFEKYCTKVEQTAWGGQIELRALSNVLKYPIEVIQATGPPLIIGEEFQNDRKPLIVTFHRYMYRLGEHYNSVAQYVDDDQEN